MSKKIDVEEINNVSGGIIEKMDKDFCDYCGSTDVTEQTIKDGCSKKKVLHCNKCGRNSDR